MSNFFYKYSDYSLFQKAFNDCEGEDVVVDILSTDESLKETEIIEKKHVIRKDNRFSQESSFNKFFGPRKSLNQNFDMKDFSSWKNKNYRETEKQLGSKDSDRVKFSFSDFMAERSGNKIYNDADENRSNNQKAINELSSDDSTFKRFSLNDYMRRLEEKTRVKSETRDNEDLIDSIGDITQDVVPDSHQDEDFEESVSNVDVEHFVDDDSFAGDKYAVDTSELDAMKTRLDDILAKTSEINQMINETQPSEDDEQPQTIIDIQPNEDEESLSDIDDSADMQPDSNEEIVQEQTDITETSEDKTEKTQESEEQEPASSEKSEDSQKQAEQTQVVVVAAEQEDKSKELIEKINKNEQERKEIEEKLKQAEQEKLAAMKSYEQRLRELEKSIQEKDKEHREQALRIKIKNDNKINEVQQEFRAREAEIRRLEKEAALKQRIGALLKKELKNNLSISNLEMNNKLLEVSSMINAEKQREKAKPKKPATTRKRKTRRRVDSDIIGGIDFD